MAYAKKDANGNIQALSLTKSTECTEALNNESELKQAMIAILGKNDLDAITSDLAMVRVVEDLIDVLIAKSLISINDLPQAVQLKLLKRKNLRTQGMFNTNNNELINL